MTETAEMIDPITGEIIYQKELAEALLEQAREQRASLQAPGRAAGRPDEERAPYCAGGGDHRAPGPRETRGGRERERARNGTRAKTVLTEVGPVRIDVCSQRP